MSPTAGMYKEWKRPPGIRGWVDGGTCLVLLIWIGLLFAFPNRPIADDTTLPFPEYIVGVSPIPLSAVALSRRPDLIALPSAVSFGADDPVEDTLSGVPPFFSRVERTLQVPPQPSDSEYQTLRATRLRAAAMKSIGDTIVPESHEPVCNPSFNVHHSDVSVILSAGLNETGFVPDDELEKLFSESGKSGEAELWVRFDAGGHLAGIFIDQSSGDPLLDQALVRACWKPWLWKSGSGQGRVSIQYIPRTGGINANTNGNMEIR